MGLNSPFLGFDTMIKIIILIFLLMIPFSYAEDFDKIDEIIDSEKGLGSFNTFNILACIGLFLLLIFEIRTLPQFFEVRS